MTSRSKVFDVLGVQVAGDIVRELEGSEAAHWLDHGTEHPHRIALSIRSDKVGYAVQKLSAGFSHNKLQVRMRMPHPVESSLPSTLHDRAWRLLLRLQRSKLWTYLAGV